MEQWRHVRLLCYPPEFAAFLHLHIRFLLKTTLSVAHVILTRVFSNRGTCPPPTPPNNPSPDPTLLSYLLKRLTKNHE